MAGRTCPSITISIRRRTWTRLPRKIITDGNIWMMSRTWSLESWREIAAYLKRTVRTVQRWKKLEGLPATAWSTRNWRQFMPSDGAGLVVGSSPDRARTDAAPSVSGPHRWWWLLGSEHLHWPELSSGRSPFNSAFASRGALSRVARFARTMVPGV